MDLNFCTTRNGKYDLCVEELPVPPTMRPTQPRAPGAPAAREPEVQSEGGGGLPGWAIALIVILLLLFLCCIAAAVAVLCCGVGKSTHEEKEIHNNIYMGDNRSRDEPSYNQRHLAIEDERSGYTTQRSEVLQITDGRSEATRSRNLAITDGTTAGTTTIDGGEDFTINTYRSRRTARTARTYADTTIDGGEDFTVNTYGTRRTKAGRDPTMYVAGDERNDGEDPDEVLLLTDSVAGSKAGRDPTMYVDSDNLYGDPDEVGSKAKRDPTMYVDGQEDASMYMDNDGQGESECCWGCGLGVSFFVHILCSVSIACDSFF